MVRQVDFLLIKEGEHRPSSYSDFIETINHKKQKIDLYTRIDYGLRLVEFNNQLIITHYHTDLSKPIAPNMVKTIDIELIKQHCDKFDTIIIAIENTKQFQYDYKLIELTQYYGRDQTGEFVNLQTNTILPANSNFIVLAGVVKMNKLPVYHLILDPRMIHCSSDVRFYHQQSDTFVRLINDFNGSIKDNVFCPKITNGKLFDSNIILTTEQSISIQFFKGKSVLSDYSIDINDTDYTITTPQQYDIDKSTINVVKINDLITPIEIEFHCGLFYDISVQYERPLFQYLILKQRYDKK